MTIVALLALVIVLAISWAASCGLLWFVCWCFGWAFSLRIATGIWIVILIAKNIFSGGKTNE